MQPNSTSVATVDGQEWFFDDTTFHAAVQEIEGKTRRTYSGEVDLLIVNVEQVHPDAGHHASFHRALAFDLDRMKNNQSIESVNKLFQDLFNFAESISTNDPVGEFSNKMGFKLVKKAALAPFFEKLKKWLVLDFKSLPDFAVRDVTR